MTRTEPEFVKRFVELVKRNKEFEGGAVLTVSSVDLSITAKPREELKVKKINLDKEKQIYKAVRLFSKKNHLDSVTVTPSFVENIRSLIVCIEIISNGESFVIPIEQAKDTSHNKTKCCSSGNCFYGVLPARLNPHIGRTIYEWICAFLEQSLILSYLQAKTVQSIDVFNNYQQLSLFWKNLNQVDRVKVLI